jgi:hypothetical protein
VAILATRSRILVAGREGANILGAGVVAKHRTV